jgi:hypothetical protein
MLTKTTNHIRTFFKKIAILPLLAGAVFVFSVKKIIAQEKQEAVNPKTATPNKKAGPQLKAYRYSATTCPLLQRQA